MFLHLYVILFSGGGGVMMSLSVMDSTSCTAHPWTPPLPPGHHYPLLVNKRVVRILLECCLVSIMISINLFQQKQLILFELQPTFFNRSKELREFKWNKINWVLFTIKAYTGKSKMNSVKSYLQKGLNLEPLVIHSDAFLAELTWNPTWTLSKPCPNPRSNPSSNPFPNSCPNPDWTLPKTLPKP